MFVEEMRRAVMAAPREKLPELAVALWKGHAAGALTDDDAQAVAELIEAKKVIPARPATPRRRVGSRPRSSESIERRRRWVASGWLPPQVASRFTMAEIAVLAVVAAEYAQRGRCTLTIGHIAALAGVCRSTVKTAIREATTAGLLVSEEWRLSAWRSAPNTVRIVSAEWRTWLRLASRRKSWGGGGKSSTPTNTRKNEAGKIEREPGSIGKQRGQAGRLTLPDR